MDDFKAIFTALYNGNVSAAEQTAETIPDSDVDYICKEHYNWRKQDKKNYEIFAMRKQYCNY